MERTVRLFLNRFPTIPPSLRGTSSAAARTNIAINLANLYHHYYLDSYGRVPPDPDPAHFEHLQFLARTPDFRFRGDGIGLGTAVRRHRSNELGQAFCRMFLHDNLNITYFAHIEHVLNLDLQRPFSSFRVRRTSEGDVPDYFCASDRHNVYLAEAKGRYASISFGSKEYECWRKQFRRVVVKNSSTGRATRLKGYIVATRYGTESKPRAHSSIFAEDPETSGELILRNDEEHDLGDAIIRIHYGEIASKLDQPVLAASLIGGFLVPDEIRFPAIAWEFQAPPLAGTRFVGGYYPTLEGSPIFREKDGRLTWEAANPLRLDMGKGTFFGVEENIFIQVAAMARLEMPQREPLSLFERIQPFYSAISILRDGSMLSPLEFLQPVGQRAY